MDSKNNISQTAMLIASLRALACYEEDPLIHGDDYMAELFLPDEKRKSLKINEIRSVIKKAVPEGLYEYVIARTKYFDELFSQYLNLEIPQIVLLGAGYDSRACRFANQIKNSKIYELDTWATQNMKRQILSDNTIEIHPNVRYVTADFEQDEWFQKLYDAGYHCSLQTLYIWEGVTFYLTPETVNFMLSLLKQHSLSGSILSFDYQHKDNNTALIDTGLNAEAIKFGLNAGECDTYLHNFGYSAIEKLDSEMMCNRYLTMSNGKRFGEVKSIMNLVTAQIK
ncbi:SAM-dependent methyltransferase [Anaerocolumna sp. MB42-C2]|uniref:SAM-dependent methyltransferase n=1 Tax=Anaerocolumna sp. MB42-C2 TaxID=3070997 RepID=UPI0027DF955A|nr:SAM-dependent methyltransferase [Anaerocolumna sp. MB42-C2]WMJ86552.1 SAM-dependent methyltransferase [Anaerocolumna sp. MB42-C2]